MSRRLVLVSVLSALPLVATLTAQQGQAPAPPPPPINAPDDANLRGFRWRSIGPTGQGARIDDVAFDEKNPSTFYIGYAVSGLWKTVNNGTTFTPISDTSFMLARAAAMLCSMLSCATKRRSAAGAAVSST